MNYIRKIYDWVLQWAETPYGPIVLFLLAFAEASFFPIPPDALLIALVLGARRKWFGLALNSTIASVIGAGLGYAIGFFIWWAEPNQFSSVAVFFFDHIPGFTHEGFYKVKVLYDQWDFWIIFTAGFTPIPYKIFTITSGAFEINLIMFFIASAISRGARFFIVAGLIYAFGPKIKAFIDKYFNWLAFAFTALLIGGFVIIKYAF